jgi:hypothetical protein
MRPTIALLLAAGALSLGLPFSTAQATPAGGIKPLAAESSGLVEKVQFRCVRRCLRRTDLPPWACRRRCSGGFGLGGHCVRRCLIRTGLPPWACRRRCFGGFGRVGGFDGDSGFGYER